MAGATPFSDDGRPNNVGRRPSGFATIGPSCGRAPGASCPVNYRLRAASRSPKGVDDGHPPPLPATQISFVRQVPWLSPGSSKRPRNDDKGLNPMRNRERWQPSKYIYKNGKLIASRDRKEVGIGSRLMADLVAERYHYNLRQHAKGMLLDLGCGKVPLYCAYRDYVTDNICVDWENTLHKNEYLDFECDLTGVLPFKEGEFDTIILSDVLEHIPQPEHLWKEMSRILSIEGKIIMNVPFYYWLHEHPHDYYRYTHFALRRFVEGSGLRLIHIESIGGAPEIVADIFAKNVQRLPRIGRSLAVCAQWLTAAFVRTKVGKMVSDATHDSFPFGYFLIAGKPG
jgi:2-polyprenyl-3-methyl-5-hydroxy-6-metoxy-1,4-benzoquinol methylase